MKVIMTLMILLGATVAEGSITYLQVTKGPKGKKRVLVTRGGGASYGGAPAAALRSPVPVQRTRVPTPAKRYWYRYRYQREIYRYPVLDPWYFAPYYRPAANIYRFRK